MVNKPAITKPLGLVLIVTAHMVFNSPSVAKKTGILGTNITLQFPFDANDTKTRLGVFTANGTQLMQYFQGKKSSNYVDFDINLDNTALFFHITNLKLNHSGFYWVSVIPDSGHTKHGPKVQLIVREDNGSSTDPPMLDNTTVNINSGIPSSVSSHIVSVLVVLPVVVLLAALFPLLIWSLVRTKDKQQQPSPPPRQSSNPTEQETVEPSSSVSEPPLVYSVLDFPKRPSAVLESNSSDTEYAAVSYHTEKRQG